LEETAKTTVTCSDNSQQVALNVDINSTSNAHSWSGGGWTLQC